MSTSARQLGRVILRPVKKLQKPRPLKASNPARRSTPDAANVNIFDEVMLLTEAVTSNMSNGMFDINLQNNIVILSGMLKAYGECLEAIYKDQLDRAFVIFRNGCRNENLDYKSRLCLLEIIELRAMQWVTPDNASYYKHKYNHPDFDLVSLSSSDNFSLSSASAFQNTPVSNTTANTNAPQHLLLGPGELVKSSGKYAIPTKISGKDFYTFEVVIRNSDSGKVMGIKGRRVHIIEELSETVISFQRVTPGTKERLVQITGPSAEKINYAKQLMEETINRNASPIRSELLDKEKHGSNSSLNSDTSENGSLNEFSKRTTLLHSFSTNDATIGEYKYTVTIGDDTLKITGTNPDLVTIAKLVLDEYFSAESGDQIYQGGYNDGLNYFDGAYVNENDEENFQESVDNFLTNPKNDKLCTEKDLSTYEYDKIAEENLQQR
ncbi:conserved hypothetical protein [Pediculus humanus corporis]|uniref:K Homology domain-containing protein n=1 Tax=Pediculus humanus subsp. corporis TaxID=121224 RepID=E0VVE3_PEDHC|nr:uncharacterized protein Phum_PHUM462570 [Pediculus humanus corporis]EEB17349.1 conserved hypothetical protein [Pediculus humanus corporis]